MFARKLKLKTSQEWNEFAKSDKRPRNIPSSPYHFYKNKGYKDIKDWLGAK